MMKIDQFGQPPAFSAVGKILEAVDLRSHKNSFVLLEQSVYVCIELFPLHPAETRSPSATIVAIEPTRVRSYLAVSSQI